MGLTTNERKQKGKLIIKQVIFLILGLFFLFIGIAEPGFLAVGAVFIFLAWKARKTYKKIGQEAAAPAPAPATQTPRQAAPVAASAAPVPAATPVAPAPKPTPKTYKVTGLTHYMENLMTLASENDDYQMSKRDLINDGLTDQRVYQYDFYASKAELVPEPDNPHDPKAIKVVVDGQHVGYIKAGSCAHLNKVIRENRVEKIDVEVGGGKYKIVHEDCDEFGEDVYELERDDLPFYVHLHIVERDV